MTFRTLFTLLGLALLASPATAQVVGGSLTADHGSVWEIYKPGATTQGFLQIHNVGATDDSLTSVNCPVGASTQLVDASGKPLASVTVPAGGTVTLAANGPHFIITNAHFNIEFGTVVPCALSFASGASLGAYLNAVNPPASTTN